MTWQEQVMAELTEDVQADATISSWEREIQRPLKGSSMEEQTAARIATALEAIALELAEYNAVQRPLQDAPPRPHSQWAGTPGVISANPDPQWRCPLHNAAKLVPAGFSQRTQKAYAAFVACEVPGCTQRPPRTASRQLP